MAALPLPSDLIAFWRDAGPSRWFRKDDAFDTLFRSRFLEAHEAASRGELDGWTSTPDGSLALLLLLDQFPRNSFRGSPRAFATDARARDVARRAIDARHDQQVDAPLRAFFYLPFMHSESLADQDVSVALNEGAGEESLRFARLHRDIVARFGRFPHRNDVLGRTSTPEEIEFLAQGGFAG